MISFSRIPLTLSLARSIPIHWLTLATTSHHIALAHVHRVRANSQCGENGIYVHGMCMFIIAIKEWQCSTVVLMFSHETHQLANGSLMVLESPFLFDSVFITNLHFGSGFFAPLSLSLSALSLAVFSPLRVLIIIVIFCVVFSVHFISVAHSSAFTWFI